MKGRKRATGPAKLPVQQLAILAACRFAEPIASTSVFPYLPEMIESFGVDKVHVAKWAGITSAAFSLAQCTTAVAWGRASDNFGRKPIILLGLFITMSMTVLWGFSTSLTMAITVRALSGGGNGNVGIIRTAVAEMVQDHKELQPRAFSVMPLVWSIGSILGPAFGGFFARPATNFPGLFGNSTFFIKFPFALPNLIAAVFFLCGLAIGILYFKETLETRKNKPDYGLYVGKKLVACLKRKPAKRRAIESEYEDESAALLRPTTAISDSSRAFEDDWESSENKLTPPRPTIMEVLTEQSVINLAVYTFLALHSIAFDQVIPIFMHHPRQTPDEFNTNLPFKFSGGFGLSSGRIGLIFTLYGVVGGFVQFVIFPPVARRYGILNCLKVCAITFPLVYIATPYTALIQDPILQQATMLGIMVIKSFSVIFAFPCSTILLTNSAISLRTLGTLNGVATSVSAVGRAIGPASIGSIFTLGVEHGYMVFPWFTLAFIAAIGAIPVWLLVEMDGFNSGDNSDDSDEDDEEGESSAIPGEIIEGDEFMQADLSEEAIDVVEGPPLSDIRARRFYPGSGRRLSSPIGIRNVGPGGSRRLSNGIGLTNDGVGTGGTAFN